MELLDRRGTTTEARLTLNHEREEFVELMRQRRSAIVSARSTMLQEIETKKLTQRRALDLERSLMFQEIHAKKEAALLQIRNERMQFEKDHLHRFSTLSASLPSCPLPKSTIPRTLSNMEGGLQPGFPRRASKVPTVAYIEETDGIRTDLLAQVTSYPAVDDHCFVLNGLSQQPSTGYFLSSLLYSQHPCWSIITTSMEVANVHGGLVLISPSMDDLFTILVPTPPKCIDSPLSKGYVGGNEDVYPPISKGTGHDVWYGGQRYFQVNSHSMVVRNEHKEFWKGSYKNLGEDVGDLSVFEVLECVVESTSGEPKIIGRQFLRHSNLISIGCEVPPFVHSDVEGGRKCLRQEVFYSSQSTLSKTSSMYNT
jgi:hypothetical protein